MSFSTRLGEGDKGPMGESPLVGTGPASNSATPLSSVGFSRNPSSQTHFPPPEITVLSANERMPFPTAEAEK